MSDKMPPPTPNIEISTTIREGGRPLPDPHAACERDELRAALNEALAQNERFNTRYRDAEAEVERLRAALAYIANVATSVALGLDDGIDHQWYADEIARVLALHKEC